MTLNNLLVLALKFYLNNTATNSRLAPTLQSCFERIINLKEININFGKTIFLKSRAERKPANRYALFLGNLQFQTN